MAGRKTHEWRKFQEGCTLGKKKSDIMFSVRCGKEMDDTTRKDV